MLRPLVLITACLALGAAAPGSAEPAAKAACPGTGAAIVVDTAAHRLRLCERGAVVGEFPVALGRGGTGKARQGDLRTPLGAYPLGPPRRSRRFHLFIPVGYPTKEQAARGASGGDIGVHGPDHRLRGLGRLTSLVDWTQGCIAVSDDAAIETIAVWVKRTGARSIQIR